MKDINYNTKITMKAIESSRQGMSLIEVILAMAIITIAILGILGSFSSNIVVVENNQEMSLAINAGRAKMETLQDYSNFSLIFANHSGVNASFDVTGLRPVAGAPNGKPGQIIFPGTGGALLENVTNTTLGMPRDLNGDGVVDGSNHAADYKILPVTVKIEWKGVNGPQNYQLHAIIVSK